MMVGGAKAPGGMTLVALMHDPPAGCGSVQAGTGMLVPYDTLVFVGVPNCTSKSLTPTEMMVGCEWSPRAKEVAVPFLPPDGVYALGAICAVPTAPFAMLLAATPPVAI